MNQSANNQSPEIMPGITMNPDGSMTVVQSGTTIQHTLPQEVIRTLRETGKWEGALQTIEITMDETGHTTAKLVEPERRVQTRRANDFRNVPLSKPEVERQMNTLLKEALRCGFEVTIDKKIKATVEAPKNRLEWNEIKSTDYDYIPRVVKAKL